MLRSGRGGGVASETGSSLRSPFPQGLPRNRNRCQTSFRFRSSVLPANTQQMQESSMSRGNNS